MAIEDGWRLTPAAHRLLVAAPTLSDPEFFRTVIFTCDTLQFGQASQNLETLNWYIDTQEYTKICKNMEPLSADQQTGRDRNALRLESVKQWWKSRAPRGAEGRTGVGR